MLKVSANGFDTAPLKRSRVMEISEIQLLGHGHQNKQNIKITT